MNKIPIRFYLFVLAVTLFFGVCFTSADFITMPIASLRDVALLLAQWLVLVAALFGLMLLASAGRYVFAASLPLLALVCSTLAYYRYTLHVTLTPMIWDAALDNDMRTSAELLTGGLFLFVSAALAVSAGFVYVRLKYIKSPKPLYPLALGLLLLAGFTQADAFKRPISERIPFNVYYTAKKYWEEKQLINEERKDLTDCLECGEEDDLTVVFVLGESLRPDHAGLNGYARNTTPCLEQDSVLSFPLIYTEQTYTIRSVPHLLTRADSTDYSLAYKEKSFIHLLNACGFHTVWLANQEGAGTYTYFMNECDTVFRVNIGKSPYVFDKWVDGDLLPAFQQALQAEGKTFILLHTIGSHWWYNAHYPDAFERFQPVARSRILSSNSREEIINSYDNTVLYTDYFLHTLIDQLRERNAILIYQSDHGESLGEEGVWLHASETPYTHQAACFVWMSPTYKANHPLQYDNAVANRQKPYRSDYLFHSLIEASGLRSPYLNPSLSIFQPGWKSE
ncbi:MAG: phosphoethanolamine transferase [Tannerellaceae bacterium]|jgi:glucan phosphoethanolaminetransferase (alkaline phosphatase superfamily)|nr:phosphoethanolamine transferase [Tannerellaceae bacterium]